MRTASKAEATLPPASDEKPSERVVTVVASTDPQKVLAIIAQQRAAHARRGRLRAGSLALLVLGMAAGALLIPRFRQRSLAAARVDTPAPATREIPVAMTIPAPTTSEVLTAEAEEVAPAETPDARCQGDFKAHQWRAAIESCGAAFDVEPSAPLAMRLAHAHWAHGDAAGAGTWGRRALELGTNDADAYVLVGNSERAAGDPAAAVAAYRQYLEQAPRGWHAARLRGAIRTLAPAVASKKQAAR